MNINTYFCNMKKLFYILLLPWGLFTSCKNGQITDNLYFIDYLVNDDKYDSAYSAILEIDTMKIINSDDRAHYYLLRTQLNYLTGNPDTTNSLDNIVIPYYHDNNMKDKLADAYYYKAYQELTEKKIENAVRYYKQAESLIAQSSNIRLKFKIAESLSYINEISGNYHLQLAYSRKALAFAEVRNNKEWIADTYYRIATAFSNLGEVDSINYYVGKTLPLIGEVKEEYLPTFLASIGFLYKKDNPEMAKTYLKKSLSICELSWALEHLADIYYREGNKEEAYRLWKKALITDGNLPKDNLIHSILSYEIGNEDNNHVCEHIEEMIHIKDSMLHQLRNDTIKDLQLRIDKDNAVHEADQRLICWQWLLFGVVVLVSILSVYILRKSYTNRLKFQEQETQINEYSSQIALLKTRKTEAENQISELKKSKITNEQKILELDGIVEEDNKTIERLNREISLRMDQFSSRVREGRLLFDHIKENGTTSQWENDDYRKFNEYYERTHTKALEKLRKGRTKAQLSPHNLFYLILVEIGKTDKDVRDIMGISQEALRTLRFRTKREDLQH